MADQDPAVLDILQEPILVIDRSYRIVSANRAAQERFAIAGVPTERRYCYYVSHGLDKPCGQQGIECPASRVFATGERARVVHIHRSSRGQTVVEEIVASPIFDAEGRVWQVVEEVRSGDALLESRELLDHLTEKLERLRGIVPTCAQCKKIRLPDGQWEPFEVYIENRSSAQFSHGLCPDCVVQLYPRFHNGDRP